MAGLAIVAGIDVVRWLSFGHPAIVATHTVAGDLLMIHPLQGQPAGSSMAILAPGAGGGMICRLAFTLHPVMADDTGRSGKKMVKPCNAETPEVVALTAFQVGRDVIGIFPAGKDPVMTLPATRWRTPVGPVTVAIATVHVTVRALQGEAGIVVIELGCADSAKWYLEGPGIVAGAAFLPGYDMFGRALGDVSIVAAAALGGGVFEVIIRVTILALQSGVYPVGDQRRGLVIIAFRLVFCGGNKQAPRQEKCQGQYQAMQKTRQ